MERASPLKTAASEVPIELRVEALGYGAFGVARTDLGVVFVAGAAPGDRVRARIVAARGNHREAEIVEVLEPGPARRVPPCRYVPKCGGCTWQHVDYPAQLAAKEAVLRSTLERVGGLAPAALEIAPAIPSAEWEYRHRVTLRVEGEQRLGFYQHRSHELVEIESCRIADATVNASLATARAWLRGVSTTVRRLEIASTTGARVALVANCEGPFRHDDEYHERFLRGHRALSGIVLFGKGWRRSFGKPVVALEVEDGSTIESEGGFTQVNPAGNRRLVASALELATPRADDTVLDLYCGSGNFTLPLARRTARVVGVESDASGIARARLNADRWGLRNCRFVQQQAGAAAKSLVAEGTKFSLVLLDPPRSGAADLVDGLSALATERVVYVSCDPVTLARDLGKLVTRGFRVGRIQPIDLFPQTYHLETVVRLDRT